jgi:Dyp-type peroxidase family
MRREVTSKNIQGLADLVVCAPIKRGLIPALVGATYRTRLETAAEALHVLRVTAREHEMFNPFTDVVERVQTLLAYRIGVLQTEDMSEPHFILAATFDRPWEPYIRMIWRPLGTFLDVLLCNCEGYVTATDSSFEDYVQWVRNHQVDISLFYSTTPLTVGDERYLGKFERLQRAGGAAGDDLAIAKLVADDPDALSFATRAAAAGDPSLKSQYDTAAVEALTALYKLTDFYPPDKPGGDGRFLSAVVRDLLEGFDASLVPAGVKLGRQDIFDWWNDCLLLKRPVNSPPPHAPSPALDQIQAGIVSSLDQPGKPIKHGALLLFTVGDAAGGREFLRDVIPKVSWQAGPTPSVPFPTFQTIAFTRRGLENLWVAPDEVARFPKEFRDGMADRAGLIGDIHENHPRRWPLPERFMPAPPTPGQARPPVEMSEIDIAVQLRTADGAWDFTELPNDMKGLATCSHPLKAAILDLLASAAAHGVTPVCIQPMRRLPSPAGNERTRDHFGFSDFISQPGLKGSGVSPRDEVAAGELVVGYANDRGDVPMDAGSLQKNGSFLVVRKMRQNVGALNRFVTDPPGEAEPVTGEKLLAKMVGRGRDGFPLAAGGTAANNDFDFKGDPEGSRCPLSSHIRRANPRVTSLGRPTPRIMRRGMSYGRDYAQAPSTDDRGVVFMAYGASIAEQYEVIQRWINGGNSTGVASAQNDPLIGVRPLTKPNTFRFIDHGRVVRADLPSAPDAPFVSLEWGLYLFSPSKEALWAIAAGTGTGAAKRPTIGDAARGEKTLKSLSTQEWTDRLEDITAKDPAERGEGPDLWAAIRETHGGVVRAPIGVVVGSGQLLDEVYLDSHDRYSVHGQNDRLAHSFGKIFIGLDRGAQYTSESEPTNSYIMGVTEEKAFEVAYGAATSVLGEIFEGARALSTGGAFYPAEIDLRRDFITPCLAGICNVWFGFPYIPQISPPPPATVDPPRIEPGDWGWTPVGKRTPRCPGDFMAPSHYAFNPLPTQTVVDYGQAHGKALHDAALAYFDALRPRGSATPVGVPNGLLAAPMFDAIQDNDLLARNLIGIMVGALPPLDGCLQAILYEWLKEKSLWRQQQTVISRPSGATPYDWSTHHLAGPVKRAIQKRPAPDLLWRTAVATHTLGGVDVHPGDKIILGVVSATTEKHNTGDDDVYAVFGGNRKGPAPWPLHACPGYDMAMGTMLGILTALLEVGRIEALPAPLLVRLSP